MNALVCALSGIGNGIFTIPLIRALKQLGYEVTVRVARSRGTEPLFAAVPDVSHVVDVSEKLESYDVACCTHLCSAYHTGCKLGKKLLMIEPGLSTDVSASSVNRYKKHEVEYCVDLARQLGFIGDVPRVEFDFSSCRDDSFGVAALEKPVAVGIGYLKHDSFSLKKHWGNSFFAQLIALLVRAGFNPVILGSSEDRVDAEEILTLCGVRDKVKLLISQSLIDSLKVFSRCKACVTNETMWAAAASIGIPTISIIFSEAFHNPVKTHPYPSGVALFGSHMDMTIGTVWAAFQRLWNGGLPCRWAKIQRVGAGVRHDIIRSSKLYALKAGFGTPGPKVSIVALLCDLPDPDLLETSMQCVTSVCETAPKDSEIVLVTNEPSVHLGMFLKEVESKDSRVVVISSSRNLGVVVKNAGYVVAQGEYILSIDGDVIPSSGWVEKLVSFMDSHPEVGLVGPCGGTLLVDKWGPSDWPVGGYVDSPLSYHGYEDAVFFGNQTKSGVDGKLLDVIPSMVWCFRRSLLAKVGYLDWRFGPFVGSDADFCFKIKKSGMKVAICRTPVSHLKSGGSSHTLFSDLEELRVDHVAELRRRWYQHAHALCELYKVTGGYVPPK